MDPFDLIAAERRSLAAALEPLSADDWTQASLCGAWSTHEVAAHLNAPFAVGRATFVIEIAKAFGSFDKANERVAVDLARRLSPAECIAGLRANADSRFTPPLFGPEAPLTDTIVHGGDILQPVGGAVAVSPDALAISLPFLTSAKARRGFGAVSADGLRITPTDLDLVLGEGDELAGPARSIVCALAGRTPFLDDLIGPGVEVLRARC